MSTHAPAMNSTQDGQQHKFTRYKSVRKTTRPAPSNDTPPMPDSQPTNAPNVGLSRSMSRYKRPRAQTAGEASAMAPAAPAVPRMPSNYAKETGIAPQGRARAAGANTSRQRNTSMPAMTQDQAQAPSQSRTRAMTGSHQHAPQPRQPVQNFSRQQSRRGTQSSRTPHAVPEVPGVCMDPNAQMSQSQQYIVQVPTFQVQGQTFAMPVTEEDRVRQMIEADKARQRRLRDEQKKREAKLAAEKAEQQRREEEEQRKKEEEIARKEEEERLVKEKLEAAKREHAERKKQQSRGLFSRNGAQSNQSERRAQRKPSSEYSQRYENVRRAELTPPSEKEDLPRPYQSPPRLRKESISQPLSPISPLSPSKSRKDSNLGAAVGRPSISQRPAEPFFDAPQTAANAGERSVIVCRGEHKSVITVEPDTTVEDLLSSAAREMPRAGVDPKNDVLMECFSQQEHQGLERRMRRYEVVQKVMDSWDSDRKNKLGIIPGGVGGTDDDLQANAVSRRGEPERSTNVRMYYSCAAPLTKPSWGTFDKPQMCILRPDGQVLVGKGDDERSAAACCHMSDFEIFIPTPEQMRRLKPKSKKMYVFAVKSQSKAAVYMESNNYVHYFSTKDRADADRWYVALQSWRSWYLVERLGLGKGSTDGLGGWIGKLSIEKSRGDNGTGTAAAPAGGSKLAAIGEHSAGNNAASGSLGGFGTTFMGGGVGGEDIFSSIMNKYDSTGNAKPSGAGTGNKALVSDGLDLSKDALGYDLGGLISRIPMNEHSYEEANAGTTNVNSSTNKPADRRGGPPVSYNRNQKLDAPAGDGAFSPGGLLGRSYSQRKAHQEVVGRTSLDHRSKPADAGRSDLDWGKPLVDFSAGNTTAGSATAATSGAGSQVRKGTGPLIGRV